MLIITVKLSVVVVVVVVAVVDVVVESEMKNRSPNAFLSSPNISRRVTVKKHPTQIGACT